MKNPQQKVQPPAMARWLLRVLLRNRILAEYESVLEELFQERFLRCGPSAARSWYWRQLLGFTLRGHLLERARRSESGRHLDGTVRSRIVSRPESLAQDLRHSVRRLRAEPTLTVVVALTLSLGIGASTAVFGVLSTTLLSRIPYEEPDHLTIGRTAYVGAPEGTFNGVSFPNYLDYRESNRSFEDLAAIWDGISQVTVTGNEEAWAASTSYATWNLFHTLRVTLVLGRSFLPEEEEQDDPRVVLISFGVWQTRFGGDRDVLGRTLVLEGSPHTIVGVLPRNFRFLWDVDIWRVAVRPGATRDMNAFYLVGRLGSGVSMAQAQTEVTAISTALERDYPEYNESARLRLTSLQLYLGGGVRMGLLLPAAATACLLLIACVNVAGLLLARGQRRTAETAIRSALGASRGRLIQQLLLESIVFTLPGGVLGIGIAYLLQGILLHLTPVNLLGVSQPILDGLVLLFALVVSVVTGLLVGVVPAIRGSLVTPSLQLGSGRQVGERRCSIRLRGGMVAVQIALSVALLIGSGLVARSLLKLSTVDLGFSVDQVYAAGIRIPATINRQRSEEQPFFMSVLQEIRTLPGVKSVGAISRWPILSPGGNWRTRAADRPLAEGEYGELAYLRYVSPGYFATMNIPIQGGRDFLDTDRSDAPKVAVLSESLAAILYPDQNPVGRTIMLIVNALNRREVAYEIVGVVSNVRLNSPRVSGDPVLYLSAFQAQPTWMGITVRSSGDPAALTASIRRIVRHTAPDALVTSVAAMEEIVARPLADFRRMVWYLGLFAGIALLLAVIGLYGALAYHVNQQEHEIGVRLAVGATRSDILGLVFRRGSGIVVIGLLLGLCVGYPGTALVRDLLFETAPLDPATYGVALLVLGLAAGTACLVPALRALRLDLAIMLRNE